jgi:hypothetical protein
MRLIRDNIAARIVELPNRSRFTARIIEVNSALDESICPPTSLEPEVPHALFVG